MYTLFLNKLFYIHRLSLYRCIPLLCSFIDDFGSLFQYVRSFECFMKIGNFLCVTTAGFHNY